MKHTITAPVEEFNGQVGGIWFTQGTAETDNEGALAYFRRHGYGVEPVDTEPDPPDDPEDPGGTPPPDTAPDAPPADAPAGRSRSRRTSKEG